MAKNFLPSAGEPSQLDSAGATGGGAEEIASTLADGPMEVDATGIFASGPTTGLGARPQQHPAPMQVDPGGAFGPAGDIITMGGGPDHRGRPTAWMIDQLGWS